MEVSITNKRNKPMSVEQKNILIEFMRSHPQLLKQKFSANYSKQDSVRMWNELTSILNATPGANKEWKDWRKSWHDIQSRTKTKKAQMNAHSLKTGGCPAIPDLSPAEETIVGIIGDTAIKGLEIVESQAQEIRVENENPSNFPNQPDEINSQENIVSLEHSYPKDKPCDQQTNLPKNKKSKIRNAATQRLDKAVEQSNKSIELLYEKVQIKKDYYKKKLILMERNVVANENIVSEIKDIKDLVLTKLNNI